MLGAEVNLNEYGFAIVRVNIRQKHTPKMLRVPYKIDSGANCTTISRDRLSSLGFDDNWIRSTGKLMIGDERPTLASGALVDDCYRIALPEINIGGWVGYNWPALTSLTVPFRLLFGTDSMRFFNWEFDYESGVCRFELIPGVRQLLFNANEQSIHEIEKPTQP